MNGCHQLNHLSALSFEGCHYCLPRMLFAGDQLLLGQLVGTPMVPMFSIRSSTTLSEHNYCKMKLMAMQIEEEFLDGEKG